MLVLGRKSGEKIIVNDDIEITVIRAKNGSVRLGITAPRDVSIRRGELLERDSQRLSHSISSKRMHGGQLVAVKNSLPQHTLPAAG